jgi:molecular chaperone DnaJ
MAMPKNYYLILGISPDASAEDVKAAFRRRALELHPDRSGLESGPFQDAQEAYSVLGNAERRRRYDRQYRAVSAQGHRRSVSPEPLVRERRKGEPLRPIEPARSLREFRPLESFKSYSPSFDELFDRFWSNFEPFSRPKAERLESLTVEVVLSPEEAKFGSHVRARIPARARCAECSGHGTVDFCECWCCEGRGAVITVYPVEVSVPSGTRDGDSVRIPLAPFGIENFYLALLFRVSAVGE